MLHSNGWILVKTVYVYGLDLSLAIAVSNNLQASYTHRWKFASSVTVYIAFNIEADVFLFAGCNNNVAFSSLVAA